MLPFTVCNFVDKIENVPMVSIAWRDDDRSTWDKDAREGELCNHYPRLIFEELLVL